MNFAKYFDNVYSSIIYIRYFPQYNGTIAKNLLKIVDKSPFQNRDDMGKNIQVK